MVNFALFNHGYLRLSKTKIFFKFQWSEKSVNFGSWVVPVLHVIFISLELGPMKQYENFRQCSYSQNRGNNV